MGKALNSTSVYVIDSFPVAVCDNDRIPRTKIYRDETFRGYLASKKRYFYGLKIHLMITQEGQPIELGLTPGSYGDVEALQDFAVDLPAGSMVDADKADNDYKIEDLLHEVSHIALFPIRNKNSKRTLPSSVSFAQHYYRKRIETVGSMIERMLPKSIHAVTSEGFELKVALFVLAYSCSCYFND